MTWYRRRLALRSAGARWVTLASLAGVALACTSAPAAEESVGTDSSEGRAASRADSLDGVLGTENNEADNGEENSAADDPAENRAIMVLPAGVERLGIDRFLRERRTLMVRYLPLEDKFANVHQAFVHKHVLDREASTSLRRELAENPRLTHWLFLHGCLTVQEVLADPQRPLLLNEQKGVIAHYGRTLTFMGGVLDDLAGDEKYKDFFRRLYGMLAKRYLYRELRNRGEVREPAEAGKSRPTAPSGTIGD